MEFIEHDSGDGKAIEVVSEEILIESEQDAFIRECNRSKQVVFTPDFSSALKTLKG